MDCVVVCLIGGWVLVWGFTSSFPLWLSFCSFIAVFTFMAGLNFQFLCSWDGFSFLWACYPDALRLVKPQGEAWGRGKGGWRARKWNSSEEGRGWSHSWLHFLTLIIWCPSTCLESQWKTLSNWIDIAWPYLKTDKPPDVSYWDCFGWTHRLLRVIKWY